MATDGGWNGSGTRCIRGDWEGIASFFEEDSEYTDVPSPDDDVAHGPVQILARLRLGIEPLLRL